MIKKNKDISTKAIGRLSLYRRLLNRFLLDGKRQIFSHEIAAAAQVSAAQVRRDLMATGYYGSPNRGYGAAELMKSITEFLEGVEGQQVVLVGVGNLGRALLSYLSGKKENLTIVAAFDADSGKTQRVIHGVRVLPMEELPKIVAEQGVRIGVITVPAAAAQEVADELVSAGVKGLLNFAPAVLHVPAGVFVEDLDVLMSLDTVAYFSRQQGASAMNAGGRR